MTQEQKTPSPELLSLVNEWADSYIKSTELPIKILEAAQAEGLNKQQIRKIVEDVLVKRGLSERRIREVLPTELKDMSKANITKPNAALSAASSPPINPPPSPTQPTPQYYEKTIKLQQETIKLKEDALEEERTKREQLEEAFHKINDKQFIPATNLPQEDEVNIVKVRAGVGAIENLIRLEIPKLKNRGWKTVEITMRAV